MFSPGKITRPLPSVPQKQSFQTPAGPSQLTLFAKGQTQAGKSTAHPLGSPTLGTSKEVNCCSPSSRPDRGEALSCATGRTSPCSMAAA